MILLDTHEWYWLVSASPNLSGRSAEIIRSHSEDGLGLSVISCWEVAKKVETGKLELDRAISEWISLALRFPGIELLPLTPEIAVESTQLPGPLHRDPADQIIVATSRVLRLPLLTEDQKLLAYDHVTKAEVQP